MEGKSTESVEKKALAEFRRALLGSREQMGGSRASQQETVVEQQSGDYQQKQSLQLAWQRVTAPVRKLFAS